MRRMYWLIAALAIAACENNSTGPDIAPPGNLLYQLEASGDSLNPAGIILQWDPSSEPDLEEYRVYSRASSGARFDLRASTTSTSFHDVGRPDLDYYVTAVLKGGSESAPSNTVRIDYQLRLAAPQTLTSITLNHAIHLAWDDSPFTNAPNAFRWYRVYSTSYDLDNNVCGTSWSMEGTTVSSEFLSANLTNGVPRCFSVTAESVEGYESGWSPIRDDTPRPDARNILMYPLSVSAADAGFRFWQDNGDGIVQPNELGVVSDGNGANIDFQIYLSGSSVFMKPIRTGTSIALYGNDPVEDLTSIDIAPADNEFSTAAIEMTPGWGYVFKMSGGDGFARFGALRVTHASTDYVIFDWSFQTDPGNPELTIRPGVVTATAGVSRH